MTGYSYVKAHAIYGSPDGTLTDYQVPFVLHSGFGTDGGPDVYLNGHSLSWPGDIRFTDAADHTLNYWVESSDASSATVWVKVPDIPAYPGYALVYLYYGRAGDARASSGTDTFPFFDDFDGPGPGTDRWSYTGSPALSGGVVDIGYPGSSISTMAQFDPRTTATRSRFNVRALPGDWIWCFGYYTQNGERWNQISDNGLFAWWEHWNALLAYSPGRIPANLNYNVSVNTWHTQEVGTAGDGKAVRVFVDDVYMGGQEGFYNSTESPVTFGSNINTPAGGSCVADWVLVRRYTANEPVHGTTGEEIMLAPSGTIPPAQATPSPTPGPAASPTTIPAGTPAITPTAPAATVTLTPGGTVTVSPGDNVTVRAARSWFGNLPVVNYVGYACGAIVLLLLALLAFVFYDMWKNK